MKKLALAIAALGIAASAVPAMAAPYPVYADRQVDRWVSVNQRQAKLEARIDYGVRTRQLSQREAAVLRDEFRRIARLEAQYRYSRPGLTQAEKNDLDRRMDHLSRRIAQEVRDRDNRVGDAHRGW